MAVNNNNNNSKQRGHKTVTLHRGHINRPQMYKPAQKFLAPEGRYKASSTLSSHKYRSTEKRHRGLTIDDGRSQW